MEVKQRQHEEEKVDRFVQPPQKQPSPPPFMEVRSSSNGNLTFTKSKIRADEECLLNIKGHRNTLHLLLLLILLLGSTIAAILLAVIWTGHEAPFDFAMVFDAGSTHTEMVVYKWQADKFKGTGVVSQVASCDMEGGIGVELRQDPGRTAPGYFGACIAQGLASIPEARRSHSPLFLSATAGMRLVRSESALQAEQIMGNVTRALDQAAGAGLGDEGMLLGVNSVRIMSGQEEGVAGWISANYLLRTIYPTPTKLVGMLDMGGASTQITFTHHDATGAAPGPFDTPVRLYGARHDVYSRSYMCFGQRELYKRYLVLLVKDHLDANPLGAPGSPRSPRVLRVRSPCHNVGWNRSVGHSDYLNACSATAFTDELKDLNVTVEGSSDYEQCKRRVATLLDTAQCDSTFTSKDCFAAPEAHPAGTSFVAASGFWYVMDNLGFSNRPSVSEFTAAVERWCKKTWTDVKHDFPTDNEEYISQECFEAEYQTQLLLDGYGINNITWNNIDFLKKVNGTSVGWTLGFTIRSTNAFPEEQAGEPFPAATFTAAMFILCVSIGVFFTLAVTTILKSHCKNNQVHVKQET